MIESFLKINLDICNLFCDYIVSVSPVFFLFLFFQTHHLNRLIICNRKFDIKTESFWIKQVSKIINSSVYYTQCSLVNHNTIINQFKLFSCTLCSAHLLLYCCVLTLSTKVIPHWRTLQLNSCLVDVHWILFCFENILL